RVSEQLSQQAVIMPLKHRKAGEFRDIPVPGYLREMVKDREDGYFFPPRIVNEYTVYLRQFKREAAKTGICENFTPHSLRHAFVSALLTRGVAITDVAHWVGHKNIQVTYGIYGHIIPSAAAKAVSVLDAE